MEMSVGNTYSEKSLEQLFQNPLPAKLLTSLNQLCAVKNGGGMQLGVGKNMVQRRDRVVARTTDQRRTLWKSNNFKKESPKTNTTEKNPNPTQTTKFTSYP